MAKKFSFTFLGLFLALIVSFSLVACGGKEEKTNEEVKTEETKEDKTEVVTPEATEDVKPEVIEGKVIFMVRENGTGEYKKVTEVEISKDGFIKLPEAPLIKGFAFRNWFYDKECKEAFIPSQKLTSGITLYALYVEETVNVTILTGDKDIRLENTPKNSLAKVLEEQNAKAKEANLILDGWYTNKECTSKYDEALGATELYGCYKAEVVFNNGYEEVYKTTCQVGKPLEKPTNEEIVRPYMDKTDLFYVDENGKDINFKEPITKNTEITVLWRTPYLDIELINGTNKYQVRGFDSKYVTEFKSQIGAFPVLSIPSRATVDGEVVEIVSVFAENFYLATSATKVIFNEGILYLESYNSLQDVKVNEVILPSTLKVIENSFNGLINLKELTLPEGLEVIINAFHFDSNSNKAADIKVTVPLSVTNISRVPNTLTYEEGSKFVNSGEFVYLVDGDRKVLVAATPESILEGNLEVLEGVSAIQVGALDYLAYENLLLPESFKEVSYNNDRANYEFYVGHELTDMAFVGPDADPREAKTMDSSAYSIVSDLKNHQYVRFLSTAYPQEMNKYAFNHNSNFENLGETHLIFVKEVLEGNITINYVLTKKETGEKQNGSIDADVKTVFTEGSLLEALGLTEETVGYKFKVNVTEFEKPLIYGEFNTNKYLEITYSKVGDGVIYELNETKDGYIVTGLDADAALILENGLFSITIADTHEDLPVVGIKEHAFEGEKGLEISQVLIGSNVEYIGEYAFSNMEFLEKVTMTSGKLKTIGRSAFEYAGSVVNEEGKRITNPDLTHTEKVGPQLDMTVTLASLEEIGANAFNSPAIKTFKQAETSRKTFAGFNVNMGGAFMSGIEVGGFYLGNGISIFKVTSISETPELDGMKYIDCDYVATAPGYDGSSYKLSLGYIIRSKFGMDAATIEYYVRMTTKEGSVQAYDESKFASIAFAIIKKIEAKSFGYIAEKYIKVNPDNNECLLSYLDHSFSPAYTDLELLKVQDASIFAEGWFNGRANSENEVFMKCLTTYGSSTPGM